MEEKEIKFDLSADKLLDLADARLDGGDPVAALRLLHKSLELYGPGADEYVSLADAYDEMEIFDLSANCWFSYLDICPEEEAVDAYEGLAACYYNMGNEPVAMYYYNRMMHDKFITPANNVEMGELFDHPPRRRFKLTWPPERADYSDDIDEGLRALKAGEYDRARACFQRVHPQSEYYFPARNYLAVCCLLEGKPEEAEKECLAVLREHLDNVQALSTYAAVLTEEGRKEDAYRAAVRLSSLDTDSPDELYKIATVCCENGLYEQAYEKFCRLEKSVSYDLTLLYFKAVAALRCGKTQESLASLGKILDVYPDAAVARYYFRAIRAYAENGGTLPQTSFFYRVPDEERKRRIEFLAVLAQLKSAELRAYCDEADITELFEWAFDESDGQESELQLMAVAVAVGGGQDGLIRGLLLDSTANDAVKFEALRRLCLRNRQDEFGAVVGDLYRRLPIAHLSVGRTAHAKFVQAYALCFSRFAPLGEGSAAEFCLAAQEVYASLEREGRLSLAHSVESLACAIYLAAVPAGIKKANALLKYLGAEGDTVARILGCVNGVPVQEEAAAADASTASEGSEGSGETPSDKQDETQEDKQEDKDGEDGDETH